VFACAKLPDVRQGPHTIAPAAIVATSTEGGRSRRMWIGQSAVIQNCWSYRENNRLGRIRQESDAIGNECVRNSAICEACDGVDAASFHLAATARLCHTHCARKDYGLHRGRRVNLNIGRHAA
jgi:hypothetical protein